jgi:penicillin-insensitive murein endopeptidase
MALLAGCCCKTPSGAALRPMFLLAGCAYLKQKLPFMKGKSWVRHDEHYHVDFAVPC